MIIYFSGTGNSRHIALQLSKELGDSKVVELTGDILLHPEQVTLDCGEDERIIWAFPTYAWGVPPVVADVIAKINLKQGSDKEHYMVTTCGDDIGKCHEEWRRLITARGWRPIATFSVQMPNTYVSMKGFDIDPRKVAEKKIADSAERVNLIVQRIKARREVDDVVQGGWPKVKSKIINPYFKKHFMNPAKFHVRKDACVSCGKCAENCPMENIELKSGFPVWGNNCTMCLRCYHGCPVHAIEYGKSTKGKGQYLFPGK